MRYGIAGIIRSPIFVIIIFYNNFFCSYFLFTDHLRLY
jgi:hypothetical protein